MKLPTVPKPPKSPRRAKFPKAARPLTNAEANEARLQPLDEFRAHLKKASAEVATWPKWKQDILTVGPDRPLEPDGSDVYSVGVPQYPPPATKTPVVTNNPPMTFADHLRRIRARNESAATWRTIFYEDLYRAMEKVSADTLRRAVWLDTKRLDDNPPRGYLHIANDPGLDVGAVTRTRVQAWARKWFETHQLDLERVCDFAVSFPPPFAGWSPHYVCAWTEIYRVPFG